MASTFDVTAASFERYRALPAGVPEAIRKALWDCTGMRASARVLDLGAGSGRIGRAFVEAGDSYVGVDSSWAMLHEFRAQNARACLVQAEGGRLPFADSSFELLLLMQVLSGAHNWRNLLSEVARVIVPGGFVVVGHTVTPPAGVDAQMKQRLALILEEMHLASHEPEKSREQSLEWLRVGSAGRHEQRTAASWTAQRTAREFLDRHRSGARFSTLPPAVQQEALKKLAAWAEKTFGSLDKVFSESHIFEVNIFKIGPTSIGDKFS